MNEPKIPNYPVVHVTVQPDGSAHVNAAGDHQDYPAGDVDATRERVLAYVIAVATRLGRGVRMTTIDPDGEWKLGVYPHGEVVDLAPAPVKGHPAPKTSITQRRPGLLPATKPEQATDSTTALIDQLAERAAAPPRDASAQLPLARARLAMLKFSAGDTAIIGPPAIVGRNPSSVVPDPGGSQLVVVSDHSRTVSRAHADISWIGPRLTVSDRGAGNGTAVSRASRGRFELTTGEPYELLDGDLLHLGTDVTCTVAIPAEPIQGER
jgi:hypothetical protein